MDHQRQLQQAHQQAYLPFMLAVKGQLKTVEMSLLRYDAQNLFLSKPESAPPVEQRWRVAPLRWSAEREPFCVLTHRETNRLRLVVAKPDSACELWPVMFSSDSPDGGVSNCSVSPPRCKLVAFMWQNGLFMLAMERGGGGGAVLQINAPQEPWVCVREDSSSEWRDERKPRITPFYMNGSTYMLVQKSSRGTVEVRQVTDPSSEWTTLVALSGRGPLSSSRVQFVYCRLPPQVVKGDEAQWPLAVFAVWVDGCTMHLAQVEDAGKSWTQLCSVPIPPHQRLGTTYVPFLPEPLLVTTSMDPHYVGSVAVRRLFLAERILAKYGLFPADQITPPRVIRYMQVPALPVSARDLTADLPITDLPFRDYAGEFVGKRLPYDLTPENVPLLPLIPPPPKAAPHGPVPLLLTCANGKGASMASLQLKQRLDWVPGPPIDSSVSKRWKVTPLRWAPGREVLFVLLQSPELRATRVAVATPDKPCDEWPVQMELSDATVPFSESVLTPFQYQTVPGSSDLFVLVVHQGSRKGGLFFVPNPKAEWQFIRELKDDESDLIDYPLVTVMYHRSKDAQSVNLCTFFVLLGGIKEQTQMKIRVLIEPNQPSFPLPVAVSSPAAPLAPNTKLHMLYTFAPKPPVTHVWPCEVFACWVHPESFVLTVVHVSAPDAEWRPLYTLQLPKKSRVAPVYLPYLAEPLLLVTGSKESTAVDLLRLNLIETYTNVKGGPKFVMRYHLREPAEEVADTTLDTALVWIPQMGLQGMHPYSGYPLLFEKEPATHHNKIQH